MTNMELERQLATLPGAHYAKRALRIAIAGNHSIRFIGSGRSIAPDLVQIYRNWYRNRYGNKPSRRKVAWAHPCPCGLYPTQCVCSLKRLRRYRTKLFRSQYDIEVEVPVTQPDEIMQMIQDELDETAFRLLKAAVTQLGLSYRQTLTILKVRDTISQMAGQKSYTCHLVEAIHYARRYNE
jgi:predicted ATPase with chaperone activity